MNVNLYGLICIYDYCSVMLRIDMYHMYECKIVCIDMFWYVLMCIELYHMYECEFVCIDMS